MVCTRGWCFSNCRELTFFISLFPLRFYCSPWEKFKTSENSGITEKSKELKTAKIATQASVVINSCDNLN